MVSQLSGQLAGQARAYTKSVIKSVENHAYVNVLTQDQIKEVAGRRLDQARGDVAICMNGDIEANAVHVTATYMADDYLTCNLSTSINSNIRINVALIMAP